MAVGMSAQHTPRLTPAMRRELRCIVKHGMPGDLADYGANALAFYAREKTLSALIRRGLIADSETATDAGRAAITEAT
jgi:hypothetical protein